MYASVRIAWGRSFSTIRTGAAAYYSPQYVFSEENIKRTTAKFSSLKPIRMHTRQQVKRAAVLIPLCLIDQKVALLYTLRTAQLKTHRGQVSFPGGMQDITDKTLEDTALRETKEELGIDADRIDLWGSGNVIVTRTETCVLPVIGKIKGDLELQNLTINRDEVEEVFTVPLQQLCDPQQIAQTQFRGSYSMPVFTGGPRRVWGLTALITYMFLGSLLPPQAYSHKIKYIPSILQDTRNKASSRKS